MQVNAERQIETPFWRSIDRRFYANGGHALFFLSPIILESLKGYWVVMQGGSAQTHAR